MDSKHEKLINAVILVVLLFATTFTFSYYNGDLSDSNLVTGFSVKNNKNIETQKTNYNSRGITFDKIECGNNRRIRKGEFCTLQAKVKSNSDLKEDQLDITTAIEICPALESTENKEKIIQTDELTLQNNYLEEDIYFGQVLAIEDEEQCTITLETCYEESTHIFTDDFKLMSKDDPKVPRQASPLVINNIVKSVSPIEGSDKNLIKLNVYVLNKGNGAVIDLQYKDNFCSNMPIKREHFNTYKIDYAIISDISLNCEKEAYLTSDKDKNYFECSKEIPKSNSIFNNDDTPTNLQIALKYGYNYKDYQTIIIDEVKSK